MTNLNFSKKFSTVQYIKLAIKAQNKQIDSVELIESEIKNLNKRQYLYSLNYAVTNGDSNVAPFIALNEFSQGSKVLLDTIKNSLNKEVLTSKYGMMLKKIIETKQAKVH